MGQFFKFLFASCLGVLLAIGVIVGIGSMILAGSAAKASKPKAVDPNTVLSIKLDQAIPELTNNLEDLPITATFKNEKILGLHDIVDAIERAKSDDDIKGIFMEIDFLVSGGFATARTLREALIDFRESEKFVIAHSKIYTQGAYYLASAADEVYVNPLGILDVRGFSAQVPFYKDMLDRLNVDMQIFYAGKFKSATEPYRRNDMSAESKMQTREFLNGFYDIFLEDVSASRGMSKAELKKVVDGYLADTPENALSTKLVDGIEYREDVLDILRTKLGIGKDDKIKTINLTDYNTSNPKDLNFKIKDRIAVVYAEGTILDGETSAGSVGDLDYVKTINKVASNEKVKAIVLRVNSPGGSALSSENIWYALTEAKAQGKPVVVSMGDYAASGGYYISCMADSIFAEPNTLTGSIGVFRIIPALEETMADKLGIHFDTVKTSEFAAGITGIYPLTEAEQIKFQRSTDQMYDTFLQRVADGRGMSKEEVNEIAQGRVWTGRKAKEIGLVDQIGDLERAVQSAATLAGLEEYRISSYPEIKDPFQQLLEEFMNVESGAQVKTLLRTEFPEYYSYYKTAKELRDAKGVQARLPMVVPFN